MKSRTKKTSNNDINMDEQDDSQEKIRMKNKVESCIKKFELLQKSKKSILNLLPEAEALVEDCLHIGNQIYMLMYLITIESYKQDEFDLDKFEKLCNELNKKSHMFSDKLKIIQTELEKRQEDKDYVTIIIPPEIMPSYDHQSELMIRNELYVQMMQLHLLSISNLYRALRDDFSEFKLNNAENNSARENDLFNQDKKDRMLSEISEILPEFNANFKKFDEENKLSNVKGFDELKIFTRNMCDILKSDAIVLSNIKFSNDPKKLSRKSSDNALPRYTNSTVDTTFKKSKKIRSSVINDIPINKLAV